MTATTCKLAGVLIVGAHSMRGLHSILAMDAGATGHVVFGIQRRGAALAKRGRRIVRCNAVLGSIKETAGTRESEDRTRCCS
jgi:hypothetical protein